MRLYIIYHFRAFGNSYSWIWVITTGVMPSSIGQFRRGKELP
jgi:hypothetical protein